MSNNKPPKFTDFIPSFDAVKQWSPELAISGQGFRTLRGEFATYWKQGKIAREVEAHICRCWVLHENRYLAAYITLLADKLTVEGQLSRDEGVLYRTFPAIKIGFLAADK